MATFTEILSKNKYCNIKVILSLRTDSYLQLKQNKAVEPKPGVFYTTFSGDGKGSSLYQIPSFSAEQAIELLKKHYTVYIIWQKSSPPSFIFFFIAPKTRPSGASGTNGAQGGPFSWKAPSPAL